MRKVWLFLLVLLLLPVFVSAVLTDAEVYYSFDDANLTGSDPDDLSGNGHTATNTGATTGSVGLLAESFTYITNDKVDTATLIPTSATSVSAWVYFNGLATHQTIVGEIASSIGQRSLYMWFRDGGAGDEKFLCTVFDDSSNQYYVRSSFKPNLGEWYWLLCTYDGTDQNGVKFYVNNVEETTLKTGTISGALQTVITKFTLGMSSYDTNPVDGMIDEVSVYGRVVTSGERAEIYNGGSGFNPYAVVPVNDSPVHAENLEQTAFLEQNGTATINSVSYAPILSASVAIPEDTDLYGIAKIPIFPTGSNTADCRITIDGAELNQSEASRDLTANQWGNLLLSSAQEIVSAGTYDFGVECKRSGGGAFDVVNTTLYLHILTSVAGVEIPHEHTTISTASATGLINTSVITTSENATASGLTRALIMEWSGTYDYTSNGNITLTTELGGVNCTPIKRYGDSGTLGSVAGSCLLDIGNETNSTNYTINIYGEGVGNIVDGVFHVKEIIPHINEINMTTLDGQSITGNLTVVKSIDLTIASHTSPNLVTRVVIDVLSTSGTQTSSYYLSDGTINSSSVSRTGDFNEAGVMGVQYKYTNVSGSKTISLIGSCSACELIGGDFISYLTDAAVFTPNEFLITTKSIWDDSVISAFSVNLSDGRSFSTTSGTITVPIVTEGVLFNVTFAEQSGTVIPFFGNTTLNFNSTADLDQYLTPYTAVYSLWNGTTVNNFSIDYEAVTNSTTTTGVVYLPLFSASYNVTIFGADADTGQELANQEVTLTANDYLRNYTFLMLYPNTFNFSLRDEITDELITELMIIELITGATAGTYNTSNGTLLLELLTPSDYTIRYRSGLGANYTERDYIQTLTNRERYDIELFSILTTESTDMLVQIKDTSGDPVENSKVSLLRYYVDCNCYKIVEMSQTSVSGQAYFVADAFDGHYKFSVNFQNRNYFLSTSPENFVPVNSLIERIITINLGSAYFQSYRALTNVGRTLVYNETTKGLSFSWSDPSGLVNRGCLYASYLDGVHYTDVTPACQDASTGSVVLLLNDSTNSFKYYAELETSTTYSNYTLFSGFIEQLKTRVLDNDVGLGAFLSAGILIVLALMFSFSAIAVLIITSVGVIGVSALGFVPLSGAFVTGFAVLIIGFGAYFMRS